MDIRNPSNKKVLYKFETSELEKNLVLSPRLEYVYIRLNNRCNAKCEFCDVWVGDKEDHNTNIDFIKLFIKLDKFNLKEINLHGGEAFLSSVFTDLLSIDMSAPLSITTNGSVFSKKYMDSLLERVQRFYISIDHVDPVLNSKSRGIVWLKNNLFNAIEYIKTNNSHIEIIINHVVTKLNADSVDKFINKMKSLEVDCVNFIPIKDYPKLFVSKAQIINFYKTIESLMKKEIDKSFLLNGNYKIFGETEVDFLQAEQGLYNACLKKKCTIPNSVLFIDGVTGNVYPCDTTMYRENPSQYVVGNVITDSIDDIWFGNRFKKFRNSMYPVINYPCIQGCDPANTMNFLNS
jgi:MoaA/NifB/PqqE/SkfB family radical SAM enzyme